MISKSTRKEVVTRLAMWQRKHGIKDEQISELLEQLQTVPGNKSFKDSMLELRLSYQCLLPIRPAKKG